MSEWNCPTHRITLLLVYTLASINFDELSTNYGHNIYDNEILDEFDYGSDCRIGSDQLELFALELGKIAAFDFVYFLASTPNLVTMYMSIRSQMCLIMGHVIWENLLHLTLFTF